MKQFSTEPRLVIDADALMLTKEKFKHLNAEIQRIEKWYANLDKGLLYGMLYGTSPIPGGYYIASKSFSLKERWAEVNEKKYPLGIPEHQWLPEYDENHLNDKR